MSQVGTQRIIFSNFLADFITTIQVPYHFAKRKPRLLFVTLSIRSELGAKASIRLRACSKHDWVTHLVNLKSGLKRVLLGWPHILISVTNDSIAQSVINAIELQRICTV